jgi:hypothetical protein
VIGIVNVQVGVYLTAPFAKKDSDHLFTLTVFLGLTVSQKKSNILR